MQGSFFSPGRVNLIGEHIDYNGGSVLPIALDRGTQGQVKTCRDPVVRVFSENFFEEGWTDISLVKDLAKEGNWTDYIRGVVHTLKAEGYHLQQGFELKIKGNIPLSSRLSSSASLEVLTCFILSNLNNLSLSREEIARISQQAEVEFVGVNCGIMDQFVIANAAKGHALHLNTHTLQYEHIPFHLENHELVILNTNKSLGLLDSAYNERRDQCESALEKLKAFYPMDHLCALSVNQLPEVEAHLTAKEYQRVRHVVGEQSRVERVITALRNRDIGEFGRVLKESHRSLRDDFEVSCLELDRITDLALQYGAVGSRMTGGGFGGCAIAVVPKDRWDTLRTQLPKDYEAQTGLKAGLYIATSHQGVNYVNGSHK